jgi:hypothetical protein
MKKMAEKLEIIVLAENTVVFEEGDVADQFYFVYSGQLSVDKKIVVDAKKKEEEIVTVGMLFSGDYFGEIAFIKESERLATITTKSNTVLLALTRDHFYECFQETPQLLSELTIRIKGKKVDVSDIFQYPMMNDILGEYLTEAKKREYLDCLRDILSFEKACKDSPSKVLADKACKLMDTYLKKSGSSPIDISASFTSEVKRRVSEYMERCGSTVTEASVDDKSVHDLFTGLKIAILEIIDHEILPRFKAWAPFEAMLKRMRAYDDETIQQLA